MSNYWQNTIQTAGARSRSELNVALRDVVADEFAELLPQDIDVERLTKMREVVRDARLDNQAKAKQLKAMAEFNEVALVLLERLFK